MALLTGEQARERGRQIVLANPAGIRIADISGQILRENPDMHEAGDTSKPSGTIRGATWDLDKKFPGEIAKTEDRRFVPIRAKGKPERKKAEPRAAVNVPVQGNQTLTGTEAGLSGDDQIRIALECMIRHGGTATTRNSMKLWKPNLTDGTSPYKERLTFGSSSTRLQFKLATSIRTTRTTPAGESSAEVAKLYKLNLRRPQRPRPSSTSTQDNKEQLSTARPVALRLSSMYSGS